MKAKIRNITFSPNTIVAGINYFFEEGEAGYEDCWIDVPDYPPTEAEPNPPTHKELVPFQSSSISFASDTTPDNAKKIIKNQLNALKKAHSKVTNAQKWIGWECTND